MPTTTYTPLANTTLGSSATSVSFSSIPATYRDLVLVVNYEANSVGYLQLRVNNDTGNNYSFVTIYTDPAIVSTTNTYDRFYPTTNTTLSGARIMNVTEIMDYSATDKHKGFLNRVNFTRATSVQVVETQAGRWANTAAITSIQVLGGFAAGGTFALYGITSTL